MSKLVIKKKVYLDFLGEEYAEAYIEFRSIPVGDYDDLLKKIGEAEKDDSGNKTNTTILDILKEYYLNSSFPNDEGKLESLDDKEELDNLDSQAIIRCFSKLTGQDIKEDGSGEMTVDPKSDTLSSPGSTAENQPQTK
jgi:hypothetical protein